MQRLCGNQTGVIRTHPNHDSGSNTNPVRKVGLQPDSEITKDITHMTHYIYLHACSRFSWSRKAAQGALPELTRMLAITLLLATAVLIAWRTL